MNPGCTSLVLTGGRRWEREKPQKQPRFPCGSLTGPAHVIASRSMRSFVAVLMLALGAAGGWGCYKTQEGSYRPGVPFSRDTVEGRYERPAQQLLEAARDTLVYNGALTGENMALGVLTGRVNDRLVHIRVDEVEPRVSRILVQARKGNGAGDLRLAAELDKQIALRLR
jgi:hypothetical protein